MKAYGLKAQIKRSPYACRKLGHIANWCPQRDYKTQTYLAKEPKNIVAMVLKVNLVGNPVEWIVDTNASSHIFSNRIPLNAYEKVGDSKESSYCKNPSKREDKP